MRLTAFLFAASMAPASAQAETLSWAFDNATGLGLALEFHSRDRERVWPGEGEVYLLAPEDARRVYDLECQPGETICYGAWDPEDGTAIWGGGHEGRAACADCCGVCGGGVIGPVDLAR